MSYCNEFKTLTITSQLAVDRYSPTFSNQTQAGFRTLTNSRVWKNSAPASEWLSAWESLFFDRPLRLAPVQGIPAQSKSTSGAPRERSTSWIGPSMATDLASHNSGLLRIEQSRYFCSISTATAKRVLMPLRA